LRATADEKARGEARRTVQKDERIAAELDERVATELGAFKQAVAQWFGEEGVREMLRAGGRPGAVSVPSVFT